MRLNFVVGTFCVFAAVMPVTVNAECIGTSLRSMKRDAVFVFYGTVRKIEQVGAGEHAATIDVDRVWKGKVSKNMTVYYMLTMNGPWIEEGKRLVIFARPQTPTTRKALGLPPDAPLRDVWVPGCSGTATPDNFDDLFEKLGRSRKPRPEGP